MHAASFEHGREARQALRAIVSDEAHGEAALANPRILAGLLGDLLPDAPRESGLLLTAADKNVPGALRDHVMQGMDIGTAISLTASSLAASTAYGPEVCEWVTTEFAIALSLGVAEQPPAQLPAPAPWQQPAPQHGQQPAPPHGQQPAPPHGQQPAPPQAEDGRPGRLWPAAPTRAPAAPTNPPAAAPGHYMPTEAAGPRPSPVAGPTRPPEPGRRLPAAGPSPAGQSLRRRPGILAALGLAVILALALAGYALIKTSAGSGSAAGTTQPGTSASTPAARASTSTSGSTQSPSSPAPSAPAGPAGLGGAPPSWEGIWIAQLASVKISAGRARLASMLAKIRLRAPSAQVLTSTEYASLTPSYWVIYDAAGFTDGNQALRFCAARGWTDKDHCLGRYLSHEGADFGDQCYPPAAAPAGNCLHQPASPAEVVESYLTSVNTRDWPEAWQLGGKNLGQSYAQMIAGYRQTSRILIRHLTASGESVTVDAIAAKTDGTAQRYALRYQVSDGVIVAGRSTLESGG